MTVKKTCVPENSVGKLEKLPKPLKTSVIRPDTSTLEPRNLALNISQNFALKKIKQER